MSIVSYFYQISEFHLFSTSFLETLPVFKSYLALLQSHYNTLLPVPTQNGNLCILLKVNIASLFILLFVMKESCEVKWVQL